MNILLAKDFTNLDGALGQSAVVYSEQGTSWSASNDDHYVLFVWIDTIAGVDKAVGRVDGRGHTDQTITSPIVLSTSTGVESVRCCFNPADGGWIIFYSIGSTVYYRKFNYDLTGGTTETSLPNTLPTGYTSYTYNVGCSEVGNIYVAWPERILKIRASDGVVLKNLVCAAGLKMHVHVRSGFVDVTRIYQDNLVVDRYDACLCYRYPVVVDTSSTVDAKLHGITGRYGNEGFIIAHVDGTSGDNIKYRAYSSTGLPLYATQTISGTGHVETSSNQGRFHIDIGELALVDDQWHTFAIRAVSTDGASNRILALIEPQNFNPQTIQNTEFINMSDADTKYGQPVELPSQFELRSLKPNATQTAMDMEVYVRQSIWMALWRIENTARVFVDGFYDPDSQTIIDNLYTTYPGGSRLAGDTGTDDSQYTSTSGRGAVNPDTTSFSSYWGTATTEDNFFIGGPVLSEIAYSFENNPNCFDPQISTLASTLGFSALAYYITGRGLGWGFGTQTPEIRITVGSPYIIQRHTMGADLWYQSSTPGSQSVDYALIVRLPLTSTSTQSDRSMIYIAGINALGTEAAAYVLENALQFKVGSSCGMLVVLEYDQTITDTTAYSAGSTGNIRAYPLSIVNANDYEGMR